MKTQIMTFSNEKEFMEWKEKEELRNFVYYSKQRGDGQSEAKYCKYFLCQHDGNAASHRKKEELPRKTSKKYRRGQVKTGSFCPSRMTCHIDKITNEVQVEYISSHSHPVSLANTVFQPIPPTTKQEIKAKLSIGVPVNEVFKDLRDDMGNRESRDSNETVTRAHLISKANIADIKRHMRYARRLHPDDSISTDLIVQKLQQEKYNCIIAYKPQGQPVVIGPKMYDDIDLKKDLFVLGIQTKELLEMFIKGANKIYCIDGTHNTNKYEFPLTTIMVPDEFNKGYPVAWLISNYADELTLRPFLEEIKKRCPEDIKINCVMTDDDNTGWNAFTSVFGESKHLLCKWHITRAWRRSLKIVPESFQDEVMQALLVMLNEKDVTEFETLQDGFLTRYSLVAPGFTKYYQNNYMKRSEKWAMCHRQFNHCKTDTNMFVESFHNKLKTNFMERKPNKRIDDLVNLLLTIEEEDYWRRKREIEYFEKTNNIATDGSNRHKKGLNIPDAHVTKIDEGSFEIVSQSEKDCHYIVKRATDNCVDEDCLER